MYMRYIANFIVAFGIAALIIGSFVLMVLLLAKAIELISGTNGL